MVKCDAVRVRGFDGCDLARLGEVEVMDGIERPPGAVEVSGSGDGEVIGRGGQLDLSAGSGGKIPADDFRLSHAGGVEYAVGTEGETVRLASGLIHLNLRFTRFDAIELAVRDVGKVNRAVFGRGNALYDVVTFSYRFPLRSSGEDGVVRSSEHRCGDTSEEEKKRLKQGFHEFELEFSNGERSARLS